MSNFIGLAHLGLAPQEKRSNEGAAEDVARNTSGGTDAPAEATPVVTRAPANPTIATPKQNSESWSHCSDLSKAAWPGHDPAPAGPENVS
jgi:hypothetical protein